MNSYGKAGFAMAQKQGWIMIKRVVCVCVYVYVCVLSYSWSLYGYEQQCLSPSMQQRILLYKVHTGVFMLIHNLYT